MISDMCGISTPNTGGTLVAVAKFHRNGCYQPDLSGEFTQDAAGSLITPCSFYRTKIEEIAVSNERSTAVDSAKPQPFTFTFADPIPVNATDLYLQVVYKGTLGNEDDAVIVATKDLFEPSYLAVFNSTDYLLYDGLFLPTTDPLLLPTLDRDHDGLLDAQYTPANMNFYLRFTGSFDAAPLGTIRAIPPGRFSRVVVLTDRNPYPAPIEAATERVDYPWPNRWADIDSYPALTNQYDYAANGYGVSPFGQLRGVHGYVSLTYHIQYGSQTTGDLTKLPALTDRTPYPVTELTFE